MGEHEPKLTKAAAWIFPWAIYLGHWAIRCLHVTLAVIFVLIIAAELHPLSLGIRYPHRESCASSAKGSSKLAGPVPRTVLWRAAYLAVVHPTSDRVQTLQALLQEREASLTIHN